MQIDTWNRDKMDISGGSRFVPGPLPKHSLAPSRSLYSGVLECPITDRVQKTVRSGKGFNSTFAPTIFQCSNATAPLHHCKHVIATAEECFAAAAKAVAHCGKVTTAEGASDMKAAGCTVTQHDDGKGSGPAASAFFNTKADSNHCCGAEVQQLTGQTDSLVVVELSVSITNNASITLTGPGGVWFGIGFFAQSMADDPYTIVVDGTGAVTERRIANHAAGTLLAPSVAVVSNVVGSGGLRTVVLSRPAQGATKEHATFTMTDLNVPFISAVGVTSSLSYHKNKTASSLNLWPSGGAADVCLCENPAAPFGSATGTIKYLPTGESFGFTNYCKPEPRESILFDRNLACDVRVYVGGLQVCKHQWTLLCDCYVIVM